MSASINKSTETNKIKGQIDYNPIYKVNYLVNGLVDTIFIFYKKLNEQEDEEDIYKKINFTD